MATSVIGAPVPNWNPNWMQTYPPFFSAGVPQPQPQTQSGNNNPNPPSTHVRPKYCDEPRCNKVYNAPVSKK